MQLILLIVLIPFLLGAGEVKTVAGKADSAIANVMGKAGTGVKTMAGKDYNDGDSAGCTTSNDSAITITDPSGSFDYTADSAGTERSITSAVQNGAACSRFSISAAYTITEYLASISDDAQANSVTATIYNITGTSVDFASPVTGSAVAIGNASIQDDSYAVITFTLSSPISIASGTYWLCLTTATGGGGDYNINQVAKTGSRALIANSYYDNYSYRVAVFGCAQ